MQEDYKRIEYSPLVDAASTWFQRWYFELRLKEEIYRSKRYGQLFALVVVKLSAPADGNGLNDALREIAENHLRLVDVPGLVDDTEFGICLPHTAASGAQAVAERLESKLEDFSPHLGIAAYPDDGETFWELLHAARGRIDTPAGRSPPRRAA